MPARRSPDPKTEHVTLRMTVSEAALLDKAAGLSNQTRSAYVRECVKRVRDSDLRRAEALRGAKQ